MIKNILRLLDSILRGIGQVMFQNNPITGFIFLCGIFYNSVLFGIAAVLGTIVSTLTASIFRFNEKQIHDGLFGFNGALVGIALSYFLETNVLTWVYIVFAAACSTILMMAMLRFLDVWKIPVLTSPFVLSTFIFLLASPLFGRLHLAQSFPQEAAVGGIISLTTIVDGFFSGIAQVFFQENVITGILFFIGLLINSKRAFFMAMMGSLTGILVAWPLGASELGIRSGAFSFNPALTAIALGSIFYPPSTKASLYSVLGAVVTTVVFAATSVALQPLGLQALTLPFVLVTWIFLVGSSRFPIFR